METLRRNNDFSVVNSDSGLSFSPASLSGAVIHTNSNPIKTALTPVPGWRLDPSRGPDESGAVSGTSLYGMTSQIHLLLFFFKRDLSSDTVYFSVTLEENTGGLSVSLPPVLMAEGPRSPDPSVNTSEPARLLCVLPCSSPLFNQRESSVRQSECRHRRRRRRRLP